jgi:F1F0 ATPase subunit 2
MTMHDLLTLAPAGVAGLALGAVFFGGLWWTVRKGVVSRHPAAWFLGSLMARTALLLGGFYWVAGDHWDRLLACLLGVTLARLIVTRFTGPPLERGSAPANEAGHAP